MDWLANGIPPWAAYRSFVSGRLMALDKQPFVRPVGVGEMWRHIFTKIVLKVTVTEATIECQDDQMCAGIKVGIGRAVHGVRAI